MGKKICPTCGYEDLEDAVYCRKCSAKMKEREDDAWSAYEQKGQYSGYQDYTSQASSDRAGQQDRQENNYQDYTSNFAYQQSANDFGSDNAANGLQIAGLVCGILAICSCCCYGIPAVMLGIAGIICAGIGNRDSQNGVGIAGMVCSIIGLILGVIATVNYAMVIGPLINNMEYMDIMDML